MTILRKLRLELGKVLLTWGLRLIVANSDTATLRINGHRYFGPETGR